MMPRISGMSTHGADHVCSYQYDTQLIFTCALVVPKQHLFKIPFSGPTTPLKYLHTASLVQI